MPQFDYSIKKQQNSKSSAVIICRDNTDLSGEAEARMIYRGSIVLRYALGKRFFGDMME